MKLQLGKILNGLSEGVRKPREKKPQKKPTPEQHWVSARILSDTYWRILRELGDGTFIDRLKYPDTPQYFPVTKADYLFEAAGIKTPFPILVHMEPGVYELEAEARNNWVYAAFEGFKILQSKLEAEGKRCESFLTVGTGPGLDAIGAHYIFDPRFITTTDLGERTSSIAEINVRNNLRPGHCMYTFAQGDLFKNIPAGMKYDVVYANLPNIPSESQPTENSMGSSTFVHYKAVQNTPPLFEEHLLAHQWQFLKKAKSHINDDGSVVLALGGRVPYEVIRKLFEDAGYELSGLWSIMREQTQPEEVIPGYAKAEEQYGTTFTFYDLEELQKNPLCQMYLSGNGDAVDEKKFREYEVSSKQALELINRGKKVGNLVLILRGRKNAQQASDGPNSDA